MELNKLTGKVMMIGLPSTKIDDYSKRVLELVKPGSVILFSRNIIDREQITEFINSITSFLGYKPLIAIDQEGGIVTRLVKGFSVSPGAMAIVSTGSSENAYTTGRILGSEMKSAGIDWNLAPVVDINNNYNNPAIGIRSFSNNKNTVIEYATQFIKGLTEKGIITCLKHFPGNGRVSTDPHLDMPTLNISKEEIYKTELAPFIAINAPSWMPTHLYAPAIQTSKIPITVSKEILTDMIRTELKYEGVLIADDLNMGGVSNFYSPEDLAIKSLEAGMDMISFCDNIEKQISVKKSLNIKFKEDNIFHERIKEAENRIENLFKQRNNMQSHPVNIQNFQNNKTAIDKISLQSVQILKNEDNLIPLNWTDNIFAVKAARLVLVEESKEGIQEVVTETSKYLNCSITIYNREISERESLLLLKKAKGKRNIIFTENAHLIPNQIKFIENLNSLSKDLIMIALRNPYDADINGIRNVICSFGYNTSQQTGILEKLLDKFTLETKT